MLREEGRRKKEEGTAPDPSSFFPSAFFLGS
jgi:hypothetical protein